MKKLIIGLIFAFSGIAILHEFQYYLLSIIVYCYGFFLLLRGTCEYVNKEKF